MGRSLDNGRSEASRAVEPSSTLHVRTLEAMPQAYSKLRYDSKVSLRVYSKLCCESKVSLRVYSKLRCDSKVSLRAYSKLCCESKVSLRACSKLRCDSKVSLRAYSSVFEPLHARNETLRTLTVKVQCFVYRHACMGRLMLDTHVQRGI